MNETDPTEYNIQNTFAPRCKSQILSVNQIIAGLRFGFFSFNKLPDDVADRVQAELSSRPKYTEKGK